MKVKVYWLKEQKNIDISKIIIPKLSHSNKIVEIINWEENVENCDWVFTNVKNKFNLWVKTADCSAIAFYDNKHYWIIHAWWRWLVNWIVEDMLIKFDNPEIFVWPILNEFEIQKDDCYFEIYEKFWSKFFEEKNWKIIFKFKETIKYLLPENAKFDWRITYKEENLASWRRDKDSKRNFILLSK